MFKAYSMILPVVASMFIFAGNARAEEQSDVMLGDHEEVILRDVIGRPCPIRFDKFGPREVRRGEEIRYIIRIENLSGCIFTRLDVTDFLPRDVRFLDARPRPTFEPGEHHDQDDDDMVVEERDGRVVWRHLHLGVGRERTLEIRARVEEHAKERLRNVACVRNQHLGPGRFCKEFTSRVREHHEPGLE